METSNAAASALAVETRAHAATDVTGFGLLGHLAEMLADGLGAELDLQNIPVLEAARPLLEGDYRTYWTAGNLDYARRRHKLTGVADPARLLSLLDPQTNGGLLVAADPEAVPRLQQGGFVAIGRVTESREIEIRLE
jgi:selenide,water dikinase